MKKIYMLVIFLGIFICFFIGDEVKVCANASDEILETNEFEALYDSVNELTDGGFDFFDYMQRIIKGKEGNGFGNITKGFFLGLKEEILYLKNIIIYILVIGIISGVANNFIGVFENGQAKNISFYVIYILMITTLMLVFKEATSIAENVVEGTNEFMSSLLPAYFMTVALSGNISTSIVFYQFILVLIKASGIIFIEFLIPMVNIYVILTLVNALIREDYLSKMAELIKKIVEWVLKALVAIVIGFNVIRGLIMPAFDSFKMTSLNKTINIIPGIGNTANAISEMLIGSAVIIKNSVGVTALICILVIAGLPLLKIGLYVLIYKFSTAIIQPIADKRIVDLVEEVSKGCELLLKVVTNVVVIFMLAIAIVTAIT